MAEQLLARLRELFSYDPDTGIFTRRTSGGGAKAGSVAGHAAYDGYVYIQADGKRYSAHRLAWLFVHGRWPAEQTDHINGIRSDNRIANLREASNTENQQNRHRAPTKNVSCGLLGASWHKGGKCWQSRITMHGKKIHLGNFGTAEEAHAAYLKAKVRLHPFQTIAEASHDK